MSYYLHINSRQRPFPTSSDESNRLVFTFNLDALARAPVSDWEREVAKVVSTAGLGTLGTDLFIGRNAALPTGDGPFTVVVDTGGAAPAETHDGQKYERLSAMVAVRAKSYATGRTRALAVWRALDGQHNVTVTA